MGLELGTGKLEDSNSKIEFKGGNDPQKGNEERQKISAKEAQDKEDLPNFDSVYDQSENEDSTTQISLGDAKFNFSGNDENESSQTQENEASSTENESESTLTQENESSQTENSENESSTTVRYERNDQTDENESSMTSEPESSETMTEPESSQTQTSQITK